MGGSIFLWAKKGSHQDLVGWLDMLLVLVARALGLIYAPLVCHMSIHESNNGHEELEQHQAPALLAHPTTSLDGTPASPTRILILPWTISVKTGGTKTTRTKTPASSTSTFSGYDDISHDDSYTVIVTQRETKHPPTFERVLIPVNLNTAVPC